MGKTQLLGVRRQFLLQDWLLVGQAARGLAHRFTVKPLVFPSLADTCHTHPFFTSPPCLLLLLLDGCWRWKRLPTLGWGPHSAPCWPPTALPTQTLGCVCYLAPPLTPRVWCLQWHFCVQSRAAHSTDALGTSARVTVPTPRAAPPQQHTLRHFFQAWAGSPMF